ncbi:MAG: hypothetical protein HKO66_04540 [Saprospiraceae bacterium]|nr:hypothetical protein [Bacteroidia bacterium]NNE14522.1 hypothetical protein [Saprospiraceae bacterium]NNL91478.1 hypothetical protein [Saprospiraceae bacterium]
MPEFLLDIIMTLSILLGLAGIFVFKRFTKFEKYIGYYFILVAVFEVIASILIKVFDSDNNLLGLHVYTLLEFIILGLFFNHVFKELDTKLPIKLLLAIGSLLILANSLFVQPLTEFPSFSRTGVDSFILVFSMSFFILLILKDYDSKLFRPSIFFVGALLVKSALSSIIYLFSNQIMNMEVQLRDNLWMMRTVINLLAVGVMIYSVYLIYRRNQELKSQEIAIN